jgi:hypothetical protein
MKTVDLSESAKTGEVKTSDKEYCPRIYITGKKLADMPAEGEAKIVYKLRRSIVDHTDEGSDSIELEVISITYEPADSASVEEEASTEELQRNLPETDKETEEEEAEESDEPTGMKVEIEVEKGKGKSATFPMSMRKKAKIDSSKKE